MIRALNWCARLVAYTKFLRPDAIASPAADAIHVLNPSRMGGNNSIALLDNTAIR
jgi:hypothetical protein